jgi:predicted glycogen debranching enzyme
MTTSVPAATSVPGSLIRSVPWPPPGIADPEELATREWLVTNGLGGYASGTVAGIITRRYHGLLIAALAAPLGRIVMLSQLGERLCFPDGHQSDLNGLLTQFRLEAGIPVWRYEVDSIAIEKRVFLPHTQNTVHVMYQHVTGDAAIEIALTPAVNFRAQEAPVSEPLGWPYELRAIGERYEIALSGSQIPTLRLKLFAAHSTFTLESKRIDNIQYPVEESRGYQAKGDLWSPGCFRVTLATGSRASLVASTESTETMNVMAPDEALDAERGRRRRLVAQAVPEARDDASAELAIAADQFIITPAGRSEDTARAHAYGDDVRTVIAGYHWFTDWGRDTMISLEGLTLVTGRQVEAGYILRTFLHYVRDGLIPNMFPEGQKEGLYHTADASLWFFHAIHRYMEHTDDRLTLSLLYPTLKSMIEYHVRGTRFGIHVDERDGLLVQGAPGYQLTWMDAKVEDWVVTPRRGKAVEINALWYNALRLMEQWAQDHGDRPDDYRTRAEHVYQSFNQRFWFDEGGYLYDVIDELDSKCRPNQVLAISLDHPVLSPDRWKPVMQVVSDRLVTPVGLRSLAPDDPDFKSKYFGDLRARDAAYHQGTVWVWLVGPFVDAWLKVYPNDVERARCVLDGFESHLDAACIGSISEVFDATPPFTPRGCIAQAWSVAEVLRARVKVARERVAHDLRRVPLGGMHVTKG